MRIGEGLCLPEFALDATGGDFHFGDEDRVEGGLASAFPGALICLGTFLGEALAEARAARRDIPLVACPG